MAASTITGFPIPIPAAAAQTLRNGVIRRRRISPDAGHALEKIGPRNRIL